MNKVTVKQLYEKHAIPLGLEWRAGRGGGLREIVAEGLGVELRQIRVRPATGTASQPQSALNQSLIGHLNTISPNQIQILGGIEIDYFNKLPAKTRKGFAQRIGERNPACIIISESRDPPNEIVSFCEDSNTPLLTTPHASDKLIDDIHYYLTMLLTDVVTLHGVFMEIMAIGVLLTGSSGVGKSELALGLITRGHRLVADDAPEFRRIAPDIINGTCPRALVDFLEVRGLGIINVRELFGASALKPNKYLKLIINLERMEETRLLDLDRLEGSYATQDVLGVAIPTITLPVAPGRDLGVIVECAASNQILRTSGYNSTLDFIERQRILMEKAKDQ